MKKYLKISGLILIIILAVIYQYFIVDLSLDSIWNYGFSYNISKGLIPYKDFNMIITPLFSYLLAFLIKIFGNKLLLYYILMAIIVGVIVILCYRWVGYYSLFIYILLLPVVSGSYNMLALLLFIVLMFLIKSDKIGNNDLKIAVVVSLMIMIKQTLGILILPSVIFAKKRKKVIAIYLLVFLVFFLYLYINNNGYQFVNYCFLGLFDFTNNSTKLNILVIVYVIICLYLFYSFIKTGFSNELLLYMLLFQVISIPIVDGVHFVISNIPLLLYFYYKSDSKYLIIFINLFIVSFFVFYSLVHVINNNSSLYRNKNSFMYYKKIPNYLENYFVDINNIYRSYDDYKIFVFDERAYLIKMELNKKINKYDLINNGNMGYNGYKKYIIEIDNYCKKNKCLFILKNKKDGDVNNQINNKILFYVRKNYRCLISSNLYNIYLN